jgi:hypothetical protein
MKCDFGTLEECFWQRKTEDVGEKSFQVPRCLPEIPLQF